MRLLPETRTTPDETRAALPGDDLVPDAAVVMDRAFTLAARPETVWPWFAQLGKQRGGWYFPRSVERFIPPSRRAARAVDGRWQGLRVGDQVPDYGGPHETFTVAAIDPPTSLVYSSKRRGADVSWSINLRPLPPGGTRVQLRLRMGPVKQRWLVESVGGLFDLLTIAGLAAGLRERLP
ncbi:MAG TPA: SRPBCC family protein [Jatrophihabitans sp.]|nr:SRPBCC family protein [Jatrophihabitans sp.]